MLNEKVPEDAIKNSAVQDPEGYWQTLESTMCNVALAFGRTIFVSMAATTR